jgi:CHRD domain-containing protein
MNRVVRTIVATAGLLALIAPATGSAHDDRSDDRRLRINLSGFQEVIPPNLGLGAIFSTGSGRLTLKIDKQNRVIEYELTYNFPDAAATPTVGAQFVNQAHLHFGQKHTVGGINVWLCQSTDSPAPAAVAAATPTCPSPSGTVSGTIAPGQVLALAGQGFPVGQDGFDALLDALQNDAIYGNVHTDRFPTGEIRGQFADRDDD